MTYSTASSPKISIHAPTWGATGDYQESGTITYDFNPRTHMGCDGIKYCVIMSIVIFQSTHPHGVRPPCGPRWTMPWRYFNPRTHMGCDRSLVMRFHLSRDFNPRTHMGCDGGVRTIDNGGKISIHAPTWGATSINKDMPEALLISIHAPTWGATVRRVVVCGISCISIHAPTWGAT